MLGRIVELLGKIRSCMSGNAVMIVALGMPALIGGTGFAVDTAQWYMWQRELQFAVDQGAIAGAWARTKEATENSFEQRAQQEFANNISVTKDYAPVTDVQLADFAAGTDNSVIMSASVTKQLPFSGFLTGKPATISVFAQASFAEGQTFTSCLVAVDEDDSGAITIGGNSVLTAGCGMAALSTSETAIVVNGNPEIDAGWILAAGGIDDWLSENTDDLILENLTGLVDPFAGLTPPNPASAQTPRTYSCPKGKSTTYADVSVITVTSYSYWKGASSNSAIPFPSYTPQKPEVSSSTGPETQIVAASTVAGTFPGTTNDWTKVSGTGANSIWEKKTTVTTTTYQNVHTVTGSSTAAVAPGTYSSLDLKCDTVFTGGIYVVDGGDLTINAQYAVTGAGVMFVLKNGAGIRINGGANVNLTAMTTSELMAQGVSASDASKLQGMLVFEDPTSNGNDQNMINGNADTVLNGTIYLPNSGVSFEGTASVTSQCLMIAASTITITGTANMTTFCPADSVEDTVVATTQSTVRLVS